MKNTNNPLSSEDLRRKMYNSAIALLARREYSIKEVKTKLTTKYQNQDNFSSMDIDELVEKLEQDGYISDMRFAEAWVSARSRKGFGPERLKMELCEKGIDASLVESVLAEKEQAWLPIIESVWRKKYKTYPQSYSEKAKQMNFLRYRGFNSADIDTLFEHLSD